MIKHEDTKRRPQGAMEEILVRLLLIALVTMTTQNEDREANSKENDTLGEQNNKKGCTKFKLAFTS